MNLFWFLEYEPIKQTLKEVEKITRLKLFFIFARRGLAELLFTIVINLRFDLILFRQK